MTGIEYFQKYGWSHAVQSVSRIPSEYNEYSPDLKTVVVNGNFRYAMAAEISKKKTEVYVTGKRPLNPTFSNSLIPR